MERKELCFRNIHITLKYSKMLRINYTVKFFYNTPRRRVVPHCIYILLQIFVMSNNQPANIMEYSCFLEAAVGYYMMLS
jgi:hypothetical protein